VKGVCRLAKERKKEKTNVVVHGLKEEQVKDAGSFLDAQRIYLLKLGRPLTTKIPGT